MGVAAEPGQDGQGFIAGSEPTTTAASNYIGPMDSRHVDTATVVKVDAAIVVVLGEKSSRANRWSRTGSGSGLTLMRTPSGKDADVPVVGMFASCMSGTPAFERGSGPLLRVDSVTHGLARRVDLCTCRSATFAND